MFSTVKSKKLLPELYELYKIGVFLTISIIHTAPLHSNNIFHVTKTQNKDF